MTARPKAILFDWDNTLVDTWPTIHAAQNVTLRAFELEEWSLDETRQRVRKSMRDSFPNLFGDRWEEAGQVFYQHFNTIHLDMLRPSPGAVQMLEELRAAGLYLGVVSNKSGDVLRREATHLGWDDYFGQLVGALDAERDKPATEPVTMALEGTGIKRGAEVWFAGDTDVDLECAANAGCVPVLIRETAPQSAEFEPFPPLWYFPNCLALSKLIESL